MLDIQDKKPWRIDKHTHGHISGDTSHIKPVIPVGHHWMSLRVRGKKSYEKILFGCQSWLFHYYSNSWHNAKCWFKATFQLPKYFKNLFQPYTADQSGKICTHSWKNAFKSVKLPSLNVICWKLVKMKPGKVCMVGGGGGGVNKPR